MKFSYKLIQQFVPQLKSIDQLRELLTMHAFEVDAIEGDMVDIKVLPNRFSDAASHWGIARETSAILGMKPKIPKLTKSKIDSALKLPLVTVEDKKLCPRYIACAIEIKIVPETPEWIKKVLVICGMRPINIVVDIMNYVMLEVGQPMHAFDAKKITAIIVKHPIAGEQFESLDGARYTLTPDDLVIADNQGTLAIAGIKGGTTAEVTENTRSLVLESANFNRVAVYKTAQRLGLKTDASQRFTHTLAPVLALQGIERATALLIEYCDAVVGETMDIYSTKKKPIVIPFDDKKFVEFSGLTIKKSKALSYLKRFGFVIRGNSVIAPERRTDIERFEDLVDEIVRLHGYENLPVTAPTTTLINAPREPLISMKELLRDCLMKAGLYEVYNYSFVHQQIAAVSDVALQNPISAEFAYLRSTLRIGVQQNIEYGLHHVEQFGIFEIGKVFSSTSSGVKESWMLCIALGSKDDYRVREMKGAIAECEEQLGVTITAAIITECGSHQEYITMAEINIEQLLASPRRQRYFKPLPKYPSIDRDIALVIKREEKIGDVFNAIAAEKINILEDIQLIEQFEDAKKIGVEGKCVTLRLIFQSTERTLQDEEAEKAVAQIIACLKKEFDAFIR